MDIETIKMFKAMQAQINDLARRIDNHLNERVDETNENLEVANDTLDFTMSEIIPSHNEQIADVSDTLDTLMTEILPQIMGMEE